MKEKIIVFGFGKLFHDRKESLLEKYDVVCILDNASEKIINNEFKVVQPSKVRDLPHLPIVVMSDCCIDMLLQIEDIIGEAECNERGVKIGRLAVPLEENEMILADVISCIEIKDRKVLALFKDGYSIEIKNKSSYMAELWGEYTRKNDKLLQCMMNMDVHPLDSIFGGRRGTPVDRYYIEKFLYDNRMDIHGVCLEIAENTYTRRFGEDRVTQSVMLHVEGWGKDVIKGNLETGEGIAEEQFDSMIITQTLMFIYNVGNVVRNIYKALKNGGTALITVAGISQISRYDDDNWGMYHSFYRSGLEKLFYPVFGKENVEIVQYGNVKTAMMFLYGG
jgi:hypothetical protein